MSDPSDIEIDAFSGMAKEDFEALQSKLQSTFFDTPNDRESLRWLLFECGLFSSIEGDDDMVLNNFAKKLLYVLGILDPLDLERQMDFIDKIAP